MNREEIIELINQTLLRLNILFCWAMDNDDSLLNRISVTNILLREVMDEIFPVKD